MNVCLNDLIRAKDFDHIISAGGDGSANIVLNGLMHLNGDQPSEIVLGFIGLGSSNDVLKPFHDQIDSIPIKINSAATIAVDLGLAHYTDKNNRLMKRYFIANSSLGVGAFANSIFNSRDHVIQLLKPRVTNLSMIYAAIKAILFHRNYAVTIGWDNRQHNIELSYLTVLKNNHVSGDLKFDQKILPDDGMLGLNICESMNKIDLLRVMLDLKQGRFSGKPRRHAHLTKEIFLKMPRYVPVEFDGEIDWTSEINFSVCPKYIHIMQ